MECIAEVGQPGAMAAAGGLLRFLSLAPDAHRWVHAVACPARLDLQDIAGMCQSQLGEQTSLQMC